MGFFLFFLKKKCTSTSYDIAQGGEGGPAHENRTWTGCRIRAGHSSRLVWRPCFGPCSMSSVALWTVPEPRCSQCGLDTF